MYMMPPSTPLGQTILVLGCAFCAQRGVLGALFGAFDDLGVPAGHFLSQNLIKTFGNEGLLMIILILTGRLQMELLLDGLK